MKIAYVLLMTPVCWFAVGMTAVGFSLCHRGATISRWATHSMRSLVK